MISSLPIYISVFFIAIVLTVVIWFYFISKSRTFLILTINWTIIQSAIGYAGIYQDLNFFPPQLLILGVFPPVLFMLILFLSNKGKKFLRRFDIKALTYFHSIRMPVEIVLSLLFHYSMIPVYMTFEGFNFDIISGLTAPVVALIAFRKTSINRKLLLGWNVLALLLLANVVVISAMSAPFPFQKLAFNQPNIAILYFPFNLLPTVVVPLVFFGHLVALYRLKANRTTLPSQIKSK